MPDISVIVPIYNVERYVERCLRSLFTQSKTDGVEFILVNDATPDNSMDIVRRVVAEFSPLDIKILENEKNYGTSVTRHRAIETATGEYSIQIDSDDWIEPTTLEELWAEKERTNADIVLYDFIFEYKNRSVRKGHKNAVAEGRKCVIPLLQRQIDNSVCFKLVRHSLYEKGNTKPVEGLSMAEDLLFSLRLFLSADKITHLPRAFYHYDKTIGTSLTAQYSAGSRRDLLRVEEEIESCLNEFDAIDGKVREILIARKFEVCRKLFIYSADAELEKIVGVYPEITPHVWSFKGVRLKQRLALWTASKGHLWVAKLLFFTSRRKVRRAAIQ